MKFMTSDGLELFYDKDGKGVPCVYLHGGPGYWSKSFQHFSHDFLEETLEMIYLDQRGCGRSEHSPTQNYSLNRLIDDMEELRLFLGFKEWYVMGHSFGGILAVNYAKRFPERTKGIILSNVTLNMLDSFRHQIQKGYEVLGLEEQQIQFTHLGTFMDTFYSVRSKLIEKNAYFKFQYVDVKNKNIVDEMDNEINSDLGFQQYVFSSDEYFKDFTSITNQINRKVLIIAGTLDEAVGPEHYKTFKFNNPEIKLLKGSHHPYIENKLEFKDAILKFVKE